MDNERYLNLLLYLFNGDRMEKEKTFLFGTRPETGNRSVNMTGYIAKKGDDCVDAPDQDKVIIGTNTGYEFRIESSDGTTKDVTKTGLKRTFVSRGVEYDSSLIDNLYDLMQIVKTAIEGDSSREVMSYLRDSDDLAETPVGVNPKNLRKLRDDMEIIERYNRHIERWDKDRTIGWRMNMEYKETSDERIGEMAEIYGSLSEKHERIAKELRTKENYPHLETLIEEMFIENTAQLS